MADAHDAHDLFSSGNPYVLSTPEETAHDLAARLKALRLDRGFKQSTLATRAGVSLASLRRLEDTGTGSMKNFLRLLFALGRLDDLAGILEPPPARSIAELERLRSKSVRRRGTI